MGRKKIEIRPLVDERNRNVTFLKRKAGLMKKAWELSVLCAADVSILIFSSAGKAYEFSSKDLDGEIDRYLEYEGLIERRRAPEFAAMALAGEDEEDEEDEAPSRRGSTSRAGANANNGAPVPKSLKGKESFKSKSLSRAEMGRAISRAKEGRRKGKGRSSRRSRHTRVEDRRSFIDGLLSDEESESDDEDSYDRPSEDERKRRRRRDREGPAPLPEEDNHPSAAGLHYAMNLHQQQPAPSNELTGFFANTQLPLTMPRSAYRSDFQTPTYGIPAPQPQNYPPHNSLPGLPTGMQWDQNLLGRYAEFQLQQNHQRQQRLLLERQRAQLQQLGIPVEDKTLLDQLFGNGPVATPGSPPVHLSQQVLNNSQHHVPAQMHQSQQEQGGMSDQFEWPTFNSRGQHAQSPMPIKEYRPGLFNELGPAQDINTSVMSHHHDADQIPWGVGSAEDYLPFPSPASPGIVDDRGKRERGYDDGSEAKRIRIG